jgi:hypothetical protein
VISTISALSSLTRSFSDIQVVIIGFVGCH